MEHIFIQTQSNGFYWFYLCEFVSFVGYCLIWNKINKIANVSGKTFSSRHNLMHFIILLVFIRVIRGSNA